MKRVIVFDFDGTVVDSEEVIIEIWNKLARNLGYRELKKSDIENLKQLSACEVLQELKVPLYKVPGLLRDGRKEYEKRISGVKMFSGMKRVMEFLRQNGHRIGILSSSSASTVQNILDRERMRVDFIYSGTSVFGKARVIKKMLRMEKLRPADVLYVGDELRDAEAAQSAGISMIAVGWGLNDGAALRKSGVAVAGDPNELLGMINSQTSA